VRANSDLSEFQANLHEIHPRLFLKVSPRAKRLALRLDNHTHNINLVVPKRFNKANALTFAVTHTCWINEQLDSLPQSVPFEDGVIIPVFGRALTIKIIPTPNKRRTEISHDAQFINIHTNLEDPATRIKRYLKEIGAAKMSALAHEKAALINKEITKLDLRDTKSRWGSCSPDGRIMLSWRLIFAPYDAMDYVVAHEVAHLKHMDHSQRFWKQCEALCLDYKSGKKWIRTNGHELTRYGLSAKPDDFK